MRYPTFRLVRLSGQIGANERKAALSFFRFKTRLSGIPNIPDIPGSFGIRKKRSFVKLEVVGNCCEYATRMIMDKYCVRHLVLDTAEFRGQNTAQDHVYPTVLIEFWYTSWVRHFPDISTPELELTSNVHIYKICLRNRF